MMPSQQIRMGNDKSKFSLRLSLVSILNLVDVYSTTHKLQYYLAFYKAVNVTNFAMTN